MKTCPFQLCVLSGSALFWLLGLYPVTAQIVPDRTLTNNSIVTPNGNRSIITGGTQAGRNLFHSFRDFSVPNNSEAFFNNLSDIQNIITRVTGGSISTINGSIQANSANLFFINPNGIIFGPNASLNIGGSFVASTASSIRFADGTEFSVTNPQASPLLTVSVPIGLQFGSNPGDIVNQSQAVNSNGSAAGLQVPDGKTLALVGGNISLDNGNLTAAGGRIELGSVETGLVNLTQTPQGYALGYAGIQNGRDIQLSGAARVDASGMGGGAIQLRGRNINLTDNAQIFSTTQGALTGGNLTVDAAESVNLSGNNTQLSTATLGAGSAGNLTLTTRSLRVEGGAISSQTSGSGTGGNLTVDAAESVNLSGNNTRLFTLTSGNGSAGNLQFTTRSFRVEGGAIFSQTSGSGTGGNLTVNAAESVNLSGNNTQLSTATSGTGSAGNLQFTTRSLTVEGAAISSQTLGSGRGGNLTVDAAESVNLSGNNTRLFTLTSGNGSAGNLQFTTRSFRVEGGAIFSQTSGSGTGGNLTVDAAESVNLSGNNTGLSTATSGTGSGGNLQLTTRSLGVEGGAAISSQTVGAGRGGNLTVDAAESVNLSGNNTGLSTATSGTGSGGNLQLTTRSLGVEGGAAISSQTVGAGRGGNLTVDAAESVNLSGNNTGLSTVTSGTGSGGNLQLTTRSLGVEGGAAISSQTVGAGRGGNLTVDAAESVNLSGNNTGLSTATSGTGSGGNLQLTTRSLGVEGGAAISSRTLNTATGRGGDVTVDAAESVNLSGDNTGLSTLTSGTGSAGNLTLTTRNLTVASGAVISNNALGQGQAGDLLVRATDAVELLGTRADGRGSSGLSAQVSQGATGNGGNLTVETGRLTIRDGATVDASTFGAAQAGNVIVTARDIELAGTTPNGANPSGIFAQVAQGAINNGGNAGNLTINTERLTVLNGAQISAATRSGGNGGNLTINASDSIRLIGTAPTANLVMGSSGLFVSAQEGATGKVGNLDITSRQIVVENGARISANNLGTGLGGTLTVKAAESVDVIGRVNINSTLLPSSLSALSRASGNAGNLNITTPRLNVQNGAEVTVSGLGSGSAGNLTVTANDIRLNQGSLTATTNAGGGANIRLENVNLLLLQNQSLISTRASNTANGGNINIFAPNGFVVAIPGQNSPGSDIITNAIRGRGGDINITASDIFGIEERSSNPQNTTNDIDASSQFNQQGTVTVNTEIDRVRGLVQTPMVFFPNIPPLLSSSCAAFDTKDSSFIITGRGGLPPSPDDFLNSDVVWSDTRLPAKTVLHSSKTPTAKSHPKPEALAIIPATGWVLNDKGEVILISAASNANSLGFTSTSCPGQ